MKSLKNYFPAAVLFGIALLPLAAQADNSVTRWVEHSLQTVRTQNVGTPNAGRLYAMVTVAMYDAVNGIECSKHGQAHCRAHALVPPNGAPVNGNRDATAAAAAHAVLIALAPGEAAVLNAALAAELEAAGGANSPPVVAGRQWGEYVGGQVVGLRSSDGTQTAEPTRQSVMERLGTTARALKTQPSVPVPSCTTVAATTRPPVSVL